MGIKVLVTGATGFTGGHLCSKLLEKGYDVRTFVRRSSKFKNLEDSGCEIAFGELTTGEGIEDAVKGVEKVFHIGAAFRIEGVPHKYFWDVNVDGTRKLLDASLKHDVKRFIHCSTVGVQGEIEYPPATEEAPYKPGDHYQESKVEGEKLALSYVEKGLYVVVFRPLGIYGPGDTRFLKFFKPVAKGRLVLIGSGNNYYQLTYVTDLVQGIILCSEVENINGEIFTLGGEKYTTIKELGLTIAKVLNKKVKVYQIPVAPVMLMAILCEKICPIFKIKPPLYQRRLDFYLKDRAFDISKAKRILGYKPLFSLEEGIKMTLLWYQENGLI